MVMRFILALGLMVALAYPAGAQTASNSSVPPACIGGVTGTLASVGDTVTMPAGCNGLGSYFAHIVTAPGDATFAGTLSFLDSVTASGKRIIKRGVAPLQVSTDVLTGSQGVLDYSLTGGVGSLSVTATAATAGRATVTLYASAAVDQPFINGTVETPEGAALRQGKAFTASTGTLQVTAGNVLALMLTNPANSGVRDIIPPAGRVVGCNNPSSALLPAFVSIPNPTTAITPTRRGGTSGTALSTVAYANSATIPAVSPAPVTLVGNPFFGTYVIAQDRTLEPGNSIVIYVVGVAVPSGLSSTNASCSILMSWFEEAIN